MTDTSAAPGILISRMLPDEAVRLARSRARVDVHAGEAPLRKPDLLARLKGRQGLICLITDQIDDELLAGCPDLRVVANVAVGFNNIDVGAATQRGVVITNTPDVLTDTTADFAWALLMATARRVVEGDLYVRQGRFKLTNVVLAPHIASASHDTRLKMATLAVDNCLAVIEDKMPPTPVNPEVLAARGK